MVNKEAACCWGYQDSRGFLHAQNRRQELISEFSGYYPMTSLFRAGALLVFVSKFPPQGPQARTTEVCSSPQTASRTNRSRKKCVVLLKLWEMWLYNLTWWETVCMCSCTLWQRYYMLPVEVPVVLVEHLSFLCPYQALFCYNAAK